MIIALIVLGAIALVIIGLMAPARARRAREQAGRHHVETLRAMGADLPQADTRKWSKRDKAKLAKNQDLGVRLD